MDRERWHRGKDLFFACLDLAEEERDTFLGEACGSDVDLRRLVEELLTEDASEKAEREPLSSSELLEGLDSNVGRRIGPYVVERVLGRGGMATVYGARRVDGHFEQEVAIKLIRRGMDTEDVLERFRSERQILARLEHPGIARLLDGGATEDGLPFLVMEMVDGVPIGSYCEERELSIDGRLGLFQQVCRAVQSAHDLGVVHRDLKPSNILVTGDGVPKLLDFGIAKMLDATSSLETVDVTATELRLLTPEYASPEQVTGDAVSPATDVHGLGVVLYELLTGVRPYRSTTTRRRDLERLILERDPAPPSAVAPAGVEIPGELETIVLKALRKEPHHRYRSARELHDDLERFRGGRPILARPPTWGYRAAKLLRRNRGVASSIGVTAIGLAVGLFVVASWLAPSDEELVERRHAEYAATLTDAMLAFERNDVDAAYHVLMRAPEEDRGWEWRHLLTLCDESTWTFAEEGRNFTAVAFDPANGRLVAGDEEGALLVHDPSTGQVREHPPVSAGAVLDLGFGGDRLAVLFETGTTALLDAASLEVVRTWPDTSERRWRRMAFGSDGSTLALVGYRRTDLAFLDVASGEMEIRDMDRGIVDLAFLPGDGRLVFTSRNGTVELLDRLRGRTELLATIQGSGALGNRFPVATTADGRIVAAGNASEARILSIDTGVELSTIRFRDGYIGDLVLSPDGSRVAAAMMDASVRLHDAASGEGEATLLGHRFYADTISYSPDGRRIVTAGDSLKLWDPRREAVATLDGRASDRPLLVESPAGDRLATTALAEDGRPGVGTWDLRHRARLWTAAMGSSPLGLAWRPDGEALLVSRFADLLELRDARQGEILRSTRVHAQRIEAIASNGADLFATASLDGVLALWDWHSLTEVARLEGDPVADVAFAPDGGLLLAGFVNGEVALFAVPSLELVATLGSHPVADVEGRLRAVAYRPDGRQVASASDDPTVRLWSTDGARPEKVLMGHSSGVFDVAYSPDGERLATAAPDGTIRFWHPESGHLLAVLHTSHPGPLSKIAFSRDGSRLFVLDLTGRIEIRSAAPTDG